MKGNITMSALFNNHNLSTDNPIVSLFQTFLKDYPNPIPYTDDDYSVSCYIEEYENNGGLCARLRDKDTNKHIVLWTSPRDVAAIEQKKGLLEYLSEAKKMNRPELYKKDGTEYILIQAILLSETNDAIELASYFAELFYCLNG